MATPFSKDVISMIQSQWEHDSLQIFMPSCRTKNQHNPSMQQHPEKKEWLAFVQPSNFHHKLIHLSICTFHGLLVHRPSNILHVSMDWDISRGPAWRTPLQNRWMNSVTKFTWTMLACDDVSASRPWNGVSRSQRLTYLNSETCQIRAWCPGLLSFHLPILRDTLVVYLWSARPRIDIDHLPISPHSRSRLSKWVCHCLWPWNMSNLSSTAIRSSCTTSGKTLKPHINDEPWDLIQMMHSITKLRIIQEIIQQRMPMSICSPIWRYIRRLFHQSTPCTWNWWHSVRSIEALK